MSNDNLLERAKDADLDLLAITDWGKTKDLFGELIAEIERLRSENKIISDRAAHHDRQDAKEIELLAARIAELEAYIKRLEAAFLKLYVNQLVGCNMPREVAEKHAREALEQLRAEGKIGGVKTEYGGQHHCGTQIIRNDAGEWHCPKCNPLLTAEQREALEHVIEYVQETQMPISNLNEFDMQELRSLLTGSKPAWEVTEERIAAMKDACNFLVYAVEIRNKGVNPGSVDRAKNAGDVLRGAGGKDEA